MGVVNQSESALSWLRSRLLGWHRRPVLAAVWVSFFVVVALRISAWTGSRWDSLLAGAGWFLLLCGIVVALVGEPRRSRTE